MQPPQTKRCRTPTVHPYGTLYINNTLKLRIETDQRSLTNLQKPFKILSFFRVFGGEQNEDVGIFNINTSFLAFLTNRDHLPAFCVMYTFLHTYASTKQFKETKLTSLIQELKLCK